MNIQFRALLILVTTLLVGMPALAQTGIVIMHGKGGSPTARHMTPFADGLESKGYLVTNLEMPWSGRRDYDADVAKAEQEVTAALEALRNKGAKKVFVAGHSQGGVFALYYASKHPLDGVIAIAPGGSVASKAFLEKVGDSVSLARKMIADGKGGERGEFLDYEGSKGTLQVHTTAAIYLTWFDPEGAMNQAKSSKALPPALPVLYVGPTNDYPGLRQIRQSMFSALPGNPLTRLYEPVSDHLGAPRASIDEILRWTAEVAAR
jgi:pimeloyl-ACP methyl ester carboxylesterase